MRRGRTTESSPLPAGFISVLLRFAYELRAGVHIWEEGDWRKVESISFIDGAAYALLDFGNGNEGSWRNWDRNRKFLVRPE